MSRCLAMVCGVSLECLCVTGLKEALAWSLGSLLTYCWTTRRAATTHVGTQTDAPTVVDIGVPSDVQWRDFGIHDEQRLAVWRQRRQ